MGIIKKRRGIFFSTDALIAITLIFIFILLVFLITQRNNMHKTDIHYDLIGVLSTLKTGEVNNTYVKNLIAEGKITDLNKSLIVQLGEFYISDIDEAKGMAQALMQDLNTTENIGLWYGSDLLASKNKTSYESSLSVQTARQVISGLKAGSNVTGYSARASLLNGLHEKYYYLGGYIGDGNISILVNYTGDIQNFTFELAINKTFDVWVNGNPAGNYAGSSDTITPQKYVLNPAYLGYFQSNTPNLFEIRGDRIGIAGGLIKISYNSTSNDYEPLKRYYFPGINGLINIYDSLYVPADINTMTLSLNITSNESYFLTIGNTTLLSNSTGGVNRRVTLDNSAISSKLGDYSKFTNQTIPIRLGLLNVSYAGLSINMDSVLVSDVSGSMEACDSESQISSGKAFWSDSSGAFCGDRWRLNTNCGTQRITALKNAEGTFTNDMLNINGAKVGIVEYSQGFTATKVNTDISTALYVGVDPNCFIPDWFRENYSDIGWTTATTGIYNIAPDQYSEIYFRKNFTIQNIDDINTLNLDISSDDGILCLINEKEVWWNPSGRGQAYWNDYVSLPKTLLKTGNNIITCAVKNNAYDFGFDAMLFTDKSTLIPQQSQWKRSVLRTNCGGDYDPKTLFARKDIQSNLTMYATIKNNGPDITQPFNVTFYYADPSNVIGKVAISNLSAFGYATAYVPWNVMFSDAQGNGQILYAYADYENTLGESNRNNNRDSLYLSLYHYTGADLALSDLSAVPQVACSSEPKNYILSVNVKNQGQQPVNQNFYVTFFNGSISPSNIIGRVLVNSLSAGATTPVSYTWYTTMAQGSGANIYAYVDYENTINEGGGESNNAATPVTVITGKDLAINDVSISPNQQCSWNTQGTYSLTANVSNYGSSCISDDFDITFFKDSINPANIIGKATINGLQGAGGSKFGTMSWTGTPSGPTNIYAYADYDSHITETNENNNGGGPASLTQGKADLWIDGTISVNQTWFCGPGVIGLNITSIKVRNTGLCTTGSTFNVTGGLTDVDSWKFGEYPGSSKVYGPLAAGGTLFANAENVRGYRNTGIYAAIASADNVFENVISETNENNNGGVSVPIEVGPNLYFNSPYVSISPTSVTTGVLTTITLTAYVASAACGPETYNISFYKDSVSPANLIYTQQVTTTSSTTAVSYNWATTLNQNTNVITVIDPDNEITESNEQDNSITQTITVTGVIGGSFLPFSSNFKINPLLLDIFGFTSSCPSGSNYNLFSPDANIVRTINPTSDRTALNSFIAGSETWQGTCICCGINKAAQMLSTSTAPNKFMVVMSDGDANVECSQQGTTGDLDNDGVSDTGGDDAVQAACDAYHNYNVSVYTVAFNSDASGNRTMYYIATKCGNGTSYYGNISTLTDVYKKIYNDILALAYKEQTIVQADANINSRLYTDSYLELGYMSPSPPYGLIVNSEQKFTDNSYGEFSVPVNSTLLEAKAVSYSGPRWTDKVWANGAKAFNLEDYGADYTQLGDPFVINLPLNLLSQNNIVNLTTGTSPQMSYNGSTSNKIIYTVLRNISAFTNVSGATILAASANGCNWNIEFEDGSSITARSPSYYTGNSQCVYNASDKIYNENDAVQAATFQLLNELDFDKNDKINVYFDASQLQLSSTKVSGIPYSWSTEVQARVWS